MAYAKLSDASRAKVRANNLARYYKNKALGKKRKHLSQNQRRARYGLSPESFNKLFIQQFGACAICENFLDGHKPANVDHDHITGEIRGLLCRDCNLALGLFKDSGELLARAQAYVLGSGPEANKQK